ncbi:hypothetical protein PQX77_009642 [Marasmius sp. AFHP31]|nr:hypothetical protein PQX77_009642 [Marasmius sp. AFHP31]
MPTSPLVVLFFSGWGQILVYGFNTVLFVMGMYLLHKRKKREGMLFQVVSSGLLFAFATISAVVGAVIVVDGYIRATPLAVSGINSQACSVVQYVVLHLIDFTAFMILVYRCYSIWGQNWKVVILPVVVILTESGVYYTELPQYMKIQFAAGLQQQASAEVLEQSLAFTTAALVLGAFANALLTLLIAGRIWWLKRRIQRLMVRAQHSQGKSGSLGPQKYDSVIAITMESGMIIPIFLITYTVYSVRNATSSDHDALTIMAFMLPQVIAFAPLLILVRVGLGLTVERDHGGSSNSLHMNFSSQRHSHVLNITPGSGPSIMVAHPSEDVEMGSLSAAKGQAF